MVRRYFREGRKAVRLLAAVTVCCSVLVFADAAASGAPRFHRQAASSLRATVAEADTTSGWIPTNAPLPTSLPNGLAPSSISLSATSCSSTSFCVSVGSVTDGQYDYYPLVETYFDGIWSASVPPSLSNADAPLVGDLQGVSCPVDGQCAAVGLYDAYDPQNNVSYQSALLETLSGGTWSATEGSVPGNIGSPLVALSSVSCPSTTFCSAAGTVSGNRSVGAVWNRTAGTWVAEKLPDPPNANNVYIDSISCADEDDCVAVGWYQDSHLASYPLIETLSSGVWTATDAPVPANSVAPGVPDGTPSVALSGIDCPNVEYCIAGGQYTDASQVMQPLLEEYQAGTWTPLEGPVPSAASGYMAAIIKAVTCPAGGACFATGQYGGYNGYTGMILSQSGSVWSAVDTPLPLSMSSVARHLAGDSGVTTSSTLSGVGCSAVGMCASSGADGSHGLLETNQIAGLPYVGSISPTAGAPGSRVTITGANFSPGSIVDFGGVASTGVTYIDSGELQATAPTGLPCGASAISVAGGGLITGGSAGDLFTGSTPCASGGLYVATSSLTPTAGGSMYTTTLVANGGVGALKWKLSAGALPKRLKLSTTGVISGTVTSGKHATPPGNYAFTVTVTDSRRPLKDSASANLVLTVAR